MTADLRTRVAKALAHPIRQKILNALDEKAASPNEIAEATGEALGNVSYHMRYLADLDMVALVHTAPARGALEHFYTARVRAHMSYEELPQSKVFVELRLADVPEERTVQPAELVQPRVG